MCEKFNKESVREFINEKIVNSSYRYLKSPKIVRDYVEEIVYLNGNFTECSKYSLQSISLNVIIRSILKEMYNNNKLSIYRNGNPIVYKVIVNEFIIVV